MKNYVYLIIMFLLFLIACAVDDPRAYMTDEELQYYELKDKPTFPIQSPIKKEVMYDFRVVNSSN